MAVGDLLIANKHLFHDGQSVLVTSWRCIPEKAVLASFLKTPVQLATVLAIDSENEHLDRCLAVNPSDRTLQETDGCEIPPSTYFWGFAGTVCINPSLFSLLPEQYPFTRPTSLLSLLHRVNQIRPNQITVHSLVCRPLLRSVHLLVPNPSPTSRLHLFLDGLLSGPVTSFVEDAFTVFSFTVPEHSTLRYAYGEATANGLLACERRAIPRQLRVPSASSTLRVRDSLDVPLASLPLVAEGARVMISLERWRVNRKRRFLSATSSSARRVSVSPGCVVCDMSEALGDVTIVVAKSDSDMVMASKSDSDMVMASKGDSDMVTSVYDTTIPSSNNSKTITTNDSDMMSNNTTNETITISATELTHCLNTLSKEHGDGRIVKSLRDGPLELHVLLIRALSPSLDHQLLRGAALSYRPRESPLQIGHRGCGMNIVVAIRGNNRQIPKQTEVENSLRGFTEAARRGLSTVEFDLQLTKDQRVVVFHDYQMRSFRSPCFPRASGRVEDFDRRFHICDAAVSLPRSSHRRSVPLPAPTAYAGETQRLPFFREMVEKLPPGLQFNIEVKYPMPVVSCGNCERRASWRRRSSTPRRMTTSTRCCGNCRRCDRIASSTSAPSIWTCV